MSERVILEPGSPAPDFTLHDQNGQKVSLASLRGRRVIVFVYPAAMTPGCTTEACDFRDSLVPLQAAGYEVIGVSPDEPERLARFAERDALTYPLLSDPEHTLLQAWGAYGEKNLYGKLTVGVIRSTFVLDEQGLIEHALYNVKATGHVARVRKLLGV